MKSQKPREIAIHVLIERGGGADFLENLTDQALAASELTGADRGLAQELIFGVVRWQKTLDWLIGKKTGGRKQRKPVQNLLRLGLYQLFWMDRIPDHAAVDETVGLTKALASGGEAKFVNAVLRGYGRERAETVAALEQLKRDQLATGYSHPEWLCQRWVSRWGAEKTRVLLEWNNSPPKVIARVNELKMDAAGLSVCWKNEGVEHQPLEASWAKPGLFFELRKAPSLAGLPSFKAGYFYIQDPSTALAVSELAPERGERILDSCAAPGGKATLMAQEMGNEGLVMAEDLNPDRLRLLRENCQRLGASCVEISFPGQQPAAGLFDKALVDAPCSNTGVMRRRVELRWRLREEEIARLQSAQVELLKSAAARVRAGGTLVYSTCSLEREENENVREMFLAKHPEWELENERAVTPFVEHVDGAYVARFRRK